MRKGQAALEFLSTYGFAFLIILVMIGALTYFGILSPGKFIPGSCLIGSEFKCKDRALILNNATSVTVNLQLVNQLGNQITLTNSASWNATATGYSTGSTCLPNPAALVGGGTTVLSCNITGSFPAEGEKLRVAIDFQYQELGGSFAHPVRAEVVETLQ